MTTSLCKLPCTQQNNSFPPEQINGPFMCLESGKQVYITSIHVYLYFFILKVYHVPECSRREKSGKNEKEYLKNVNKKSGNLDLVREIQNLGKRQGNIISYTFNGTNVTVYIYSQRTHRMLLSVFHLVTPQQYYFL